NGDQFQQLDERTIYGGDWNRKWQSSYNASHLHHSIGVQLRYDDIDQVGLISTRDREPVDITRLDRVRETALGAYYEMQWDHSLHWRWVLGIRADHYWFDVRSDTPENSGSASEGIVSPKASLIYRIDDGSEIYASGGFGFHSNDARGTTISIDPKTGEPAEPVDPLVRSRGGELGFRTFSSNGWIGSIAAWILKLDSELLFVGDAGITEPSRPSRRWGIEFNNTWMLSDTWRVEADVAWTDARFTDDAPEGHRIPGALETVITGAISAEWPNGWFGSLRLRYFSGAPLIEDGSVKSDGSSMVNLLLGWSDEHWRLKLEALNLLDSDDHDIDYFYASRLPGEPGEGIEDIHFHIFEPRQVRLQASWLF
ncbi:MAG: TonB-dependent receptor, partial [Lysobacterales bacterium]